MHETAEYGERTVDKHVWLAAAALAGAVALVGWGLTRAPKGPAGGSCPSVRQQVDDVWNEDRARTLTQTLLATDVPYAEVTAASLRADIDAYVDAYVQAHTASCQPDEPAAAPITACLNHRLALLHALLVGLEDVDRETIAHAAEATAGLLPIVDCGVASLVAEPAPDGVTELAAQVALHRDEPALALAEQMLQAPDAAYEAEVRVLQGQLALRVDDPAAESILEQAVWASVSADDPVQLTSAALLLAEAVARDPDRVVEAQRWWKLAASSAQRLRLPPQWEIPVLHAEARLRLRQGQPEFALAEVDRGVALIEQLHARPHAQMLPLLATGAAAALRSDNLDAAHALHGRAVELAQATLGPGHPRIARLHLDFGRGLADGGRPEDALQYLQQAGDLAGEQSAAMELLVELGEVFALMGRAPQAADAFEHARRLHDRLSLGQHVALANALRGLAWTHAQEGDWPAAVALFERVLTLEEARLGPQSADLAPILGELQQALLSAGRADEGTHYGQRATQLLKAVHGPEDPRVAGAEIAWAETTLASGDPATALALSRHGLGILLATRGLTDAGALVALVNIGTACLALDENEEAVAAFEHADKVAKAAGVSPGRRTSAQLGLATALWRTGKRSQATTLARDVYRTLEGGDATAAVSIEDVEAWLQRRHLSP